MLLSGVSNLFRFVLVLAVFCISCTKRGTSVSTVLRRSGWCLMSVCATKYHAISRQLLCQSWPIWLTLTYYIYIYIYIYIHIYG